MNLKSKRIQINLGGKFGFELVISTHKSKQMENAILGWED